jgi:hypothetical protein
MSQSYEQKHSKWRFGAAFYSTFLGGVIWLFKGAFFEFFVAFTIFVLFHSILVLIETMSSIVIIDDGQNYAIALIGLFILNGYILGDYFYFRYILPNSKKVILLMVAICAALLVLTPGGQEMIADYIRQTKVMFDGESSFSLSSLPIFYELTLNEYSIITGVILAIYFYFVVRWLQDAENTNVEDPIFKPEYLGRTKALTVVTLIIISSTSYNFFKETSAEKALEIHKQIAETELANGNFKKAGEAFGYAAASAGASGDLDAMEKLITGLEKAKKRSR